jgi:AraC-like DNA-binding protein
MMPALLDGIGVSADAILRRCGLPRDLLTRLPAALTPDQFFDLWVAVSDEIDAAGKGPAPVRLAQGASLEHFDPLIFSFLNSPNVITGFERIAGYKRVVSAVRITVTSTPESVVVEHSWPAPLHAPPVIDLMSQLFGVWLVRAATRVDVRPVRVTSPELPADMDAYEEFLGVPVTLAPTSRAVFSAIDAHRPLLTSNDAMWRSFEPALRLRLHEIHAGASTEERVRAALVELLPAGNDSIEAVARELAVSTRTLQRQLQAEGVTFQSILSSTRERLAHYYLKHHHLTASEVAFLLGYEDSRSFYRAFRTWTGMSPKEARARYIA